MLKIKIVAVGKVKEKYFQDAILEYSKRIKRFASFEIIEIKEEQLIGSSPPEIAKALDLEGQNIIKQLGGFVVAAALDGQSQNSQEFANMFKQVSLNSSQITFIIGSSNGLSSGVLNLASKSISFSKLTFPHTMFRVLLCEQIYRALTIINNLPYHK